MATEEKVEWKVTVQGIGSRKEAREIARFISLEHDYRTEVSGYVVDEGN